VAAVRVQEHPVVVSLVEPGGAGSVLPADAVAALQAAGLEVRLRPRPPGLRSEDLGAWVGPDAWAVLASWGCPAFTPAVLDALPRLRCIGYLAGSVRRLVTPEAFARGITVLSAAPVIALAVAEYCLAQALTLLRRLDLAAGALAQAPGAAGWRAGAKLPASRSLWGRTVGIVSASATGRRLIALLQPFGCPVVVYDPFLTEGEAGALGVRRGELAEVCGQEIVSVHAPHLPATQGLVDAAAIACIPDGGLFINTARAGVVDYAALTEHLLRGRFCAALDVFPEEPLPADSPLYGLPHVMLTPHVAGYSVDVYARMGREVAADLLRLRAGQRPVLAVDAGRWEQLA
jgi:phosphoglycerate dehydrogenase-like enzyme